MSEALFMRTVTNTRRRQSVAAFVAAKFPSCRDFARTRRHRAFLHVAPLVLLFNLDRSQPGNGRHKCAGRRGHCHAPETQTTDSCTEVKSWIALPICSRVPRGEPRPSVYLERRGQQPFLHKSVPVRLMQPMR